MRFKPGVSPARAGQHLRDAQAEPVETISAIDVHRVRVPKGRGGAATAQLKRSHDVEFVEPDALVSPAAIPNDPDYPVAWHLPRIAMPAAWDMTTGSPEVVIAILDSGIAASHEDLQGKVLSGWNFYDGNADTADLSGHGTMVAGTAAASTSNGIGVAGVGWSSRLLPVRVTNPTGSAFLSTIASGLTWAVDHGARVMNVSFASVAGSAAVRSAAQYVQSKGGIVVASAGNCGCDDPTPENPYLISVGATDRYDGVVSFSSRGAYVDLMAPGVVIRTTRREGDYISTAGTSFSSPIVAGVVALMVAANPTASPAEVESWLYETAKDLDVAGHDPITGFGRVQADTAVAAALAGFHEVVDVTPPAVTITGPTSSALVSGTVQVDTFAIDDVGTVRVDLYVDGVLVGSDTSAPYAFAWETATVANGNHTLGVSAVDAAGNVGIDDVVVEVDNGSLDGSAPAAAILTPSSGSSVTRTVKVKVSASDDRQLAKIELSVDGKLFSTTPCSGTWATATITWNTKGLPKGNHVLLATALDIAGKRGDSVPVTVTVR